MEYLKRVLGIQVTYREYPTEALPNYLASRYMIRKVMLDSTPALFVYPEAELEAVSTIKKHLDRIESTENVPAVLVPDHLTYRQKEYLLRDHIPFIVEGKQIYLPFMAVYLQERGDGEKQKTATMLPSAQVLLLYYIYHGCGKVLTSDAARELGFTATSVSRASRQLEEMGLIKTEKCGVQKVIFSGKTPKELFAEAKSSMNNPVKKTIYIAKEKLNKVLLLSGCSALAEYTMINPPAVDCFASASVSAWEKESSSRLQNADDQCEVELWRYDPKKLADDGCVDRLSLALALGLEQDERVEESVEEMLEQVWRKTGGKRN